MRALFGSVILGVSLGMPGTLSFTHNPTHAAVAPAGSPVVHVILPRRSIYIMSRAARMDWQHAVDRIGFSSHLATRRDMPPSWNPMGLRVSWTSRSLRNFEAAALRQGLTPSLSPAARAALRARIDQVEHPDLSREERPQLKALFAHSGPFSYALRQLALMNDEPLASRRRARLPLKSIGYQATL